MWRLQEAHGIPLRGLGGRQEDWDRYPDLLHADGTLELTIGAYLLVGLDRVVLVDAGQGPTPAGPLVGGELPSNLTRAGFSPDDVTDVVFTHLHADHTGWASLLGAPYFPRATYRCHAAELPYATERQRLGTIAEIADRIQPFDGDTALAPGVDVRLSPGHTPGSSTVVVSGGGAAVLLVGDATHCVHELLDPQWSGIADADPDLARDTRRALAEELERTGAYVGGGHFPGLAFGRLLSRERHEWTFTRN